MFTPSRFFRVASVDTANFTFRSISLITAALMRKVRGAAPSFPGPAITGKSAASPAASVNFTPPPSILTRGPRPAHSISTTPSGIAPTNDANAAPGTVTVPWSFISASMRHSTWTSPFDPVTDRHPLASSLILLNGLRLSFETSPLTAWAASTSCALVIVVFIYCFSV